MKAFHNDPAIKEKYLARVRAHAAADEIIRGIYYWRNGKGSAVGCTIHSRHHKDCEKQLGIPEWMAHLEDALFGGLPDEIAKTWPLRFLEAITPGQDLQRVKAPFLIFVLQWTIDKFDHATYPDIKNCITAIIELYRSGETDSEKLDKAGAAAAEAASATWEAGVEWAAGGERRKRVASAAGAARAAQAATGATDANFEWTNERTVAGAAAAAAAWVSRNAAEAYELFSDKLIELIQGVK